MVSAPDEETPDTRFALAGELSIAYQVVGRGPLDMILVPGMVSHVEFFHEIPGYTKFLQRLASFSRVATFDKRGQGLSDRVPGVPSLEERVDDLQAVMAATGMSRVVLFGMSEGASMSALFAATCPEKVSHLILYGSFARFSNAEDYTLMFDREVIARSALYWGKGLSIRTFAPSLAGDPEMTRLWAKGERLCVSPGAYKAMLDTNMRIDVRAILPQIRVPTLVLHRKTDLAVPVANGQYLARHIPGARYIEYAEGDHAPYFGTDFVSMCGDIEEFVTGHREAPEEDIDRVLATVLFTDIVDSTRLLAEKGDASWRRLIEEHDQLARRLVDQHRGRFVKSTGDGLLATFDGPARAIRCARALSAATGRLGIAIRAGLHTGEIELRGNDVGGLAVHVAARIMAEAAARQILVSRVLTDLVAGSALAFASQGARALKGLAGNWELFALRED